MSEGSPGHFLLTPRFQILPLPETELRKVVGLTPVGSTRGSFLRLCLYHSVNNMVFHLKITRLKLFTIFIYVILRKSFTYRHSYRNSVQEVKIVKRLSLPRVSYSSKNQKVVGSTPIGNTRSSFSLRMPVLFTKLYHLSLHFSKELFLIWSLSKSKHEPPARLIFQHTCTYGP